MVNIIYSHMRCKGRFSLIVRNREISVQENVSFTLIIQKAIYFLFNIIRWIVNYNIVLNSYGGVL